MIIVHKAEKGPGRPSSMATKRGKVTDRLAVVVGPAAEVSIIYGLGKSATEKLARAEYSRLYKIQAPRAVASR